MAKRSQYPIKASYGLIAPLDDYQFIADASRTFVVDAMSEGKFVEQLTISISTAAKFIDELITPEQLKHHEWWRIVSISGGTLYGLPAPRGGAGAGEKTINSTIGWVLTADDRLGLVPNQGAFVATIGGSSGGGAGDATLAEQQTQTTHLSEIEGAVETLEAVDFATEAKQDTQIAGRSISCYSFIPDGTDELLISASARKIWGVSVFTKDATPIYVKLYDKATAASEADTPVLRVGVPADASGLGGGNTLMLPANGYLAVTNGLSVRVVTGIADNDDTAVTTAENLVNVFWSV